MASKKKKKQRKQSRKQEIENKKEAFKARYLYIIASFLLVAVVLCYIFLRPVPGVSEQQKEVPQNSNLSDRNNVFLITLDTTRADHIGAYGYRKAKTPNFDYLSRKGILFEDTYTSVPMTLPSHSSLFTGMYPNVNKVRNNANYQLSRELTTLPEILQQNKYSTAAFVSSFTVDSRFGLDQGFSEYDDNLTLRTFVKQFVSERNAKSVFKSFTRWFDTSLQEPFFVWLHFFDPHAPYVPPIPFRSFFEGEDYSNNLLKLYDGEIAYTDYFIGQTVQLLNKKRLLENTHLILIGDHGEAFGEHKEMGHQVFCYQENLQVPLLFISPDYADDRLIQQNVNVIDVMPTVLELLSLPVPQNIQGLSLIPFFSNSDNKSIHRNYLYFESLYAYESLSCAPITGVMDNTYKLIDLPETEFFNLHVDPMETKNIYQNDQTKVQALKGILENIKELGENAEYDGRRSLSLEEKQNLEALGYLVLDQPGEHEENLPDPKDKIEGYTEFLKALETYIKKDYSATEEHLQRAIQLIPEYRHTYIKLAELYQTINKPDKALEVLEHARELYPDEFRTELSVVSIYLALERYDDALKILKEAEAHPHVQDKVMTYYLLGEVYFRKNEIEESIKYFNMAYDLEPENLELASKLANILHRVGKLTDALRIYQRLERLLPGDAQVIYNLAVIYAGLKNAAKANAYFQKALISTDPKPHMFFDYGFFLAEHRKFPQAIVSMKKFLEVCDPEDTQQQRAKDFIAQWQSVINR